MIFFAISLSSHSMVVVHGKVRGISKKVGRDKLCSGFRTLLVFILSDVTTIHLILRLRFVVLCRCCNELSAAV